MLICDFSPVFISTLWNIYSVYTDTTYSMWVCLCLSIIVWSRVSLGFHVFSLLQTVTRFKLFFPTQITKNERGCLNTFVRHLPWSFHKTEEHTATGFEGPCSQQDFNREHSLWTQHLDRGLCSLGLGSNHGATCSREDGRWEPGASGQLYPSPASRASSCREPGWAHTQASVCQPPSLPRQVNKICQWGSIQAQSTKAWKLWKCSICKDSKLQIVVTKAVANA